MILGSIIVVALLALAWHLWRTSTDVYNSALQPADKVDSAPINDQITDAVTQTAKKTKKSTKAKVSDSATKKVAKPKTAKKDTKKKAA